MITPDAALLSDLRHSSRSTACYPVGLSLFGEGEDVTEREYDLDTRLWLGRSSATRSPAAPCRRRSTPDDLEPLRVVERRITDEMADG
jgi:hypothetical protein